jgi:hypothetical protein
MKISKSLFLLLFIFFSYGAAFGQLEGNPENWCREGFFPRESEQYRLARITGQKGERVYFYGDDENCPDGKNCRRKSYLIPNDEIIVSRTFGRFACSWFQPSKGAETVGWIETKNIEFVEAAQTPDEKDWLGEWRYDDNRIEIEKGAQDGFFKIKGDAIWKGIGDNVHVGTLDDEVKPQRNVLKIGESSEDEYECRATLRLIGKYLIASDNLNCGGANVSFTGVYRRK